MLTPRRALAAAASALTLAGGLSALAAPASAAPADGADTAAVTWSAPAAPRSIVATPAPASCKDITRPGAASCFADLGSKLSDADAAEAGEANAVAQATVSPNAAAAPLAGLNQSGGYAPADLASLYGLPAAALQGDPTAPGAPVVGIVDAGYDPNIEAELSFYRSFFGLSACTTTNGCLSLVDQTGRLINHSTPQVPFYPGWHAEIALDVEAVSAICPGCRIVLVAADDNDLTNLGEGVTAATRLGARYVSMSFGGDEFDGAGSLDAQYFGHTDAHGRHDVTYVAATGDDGYTAGAASYPAVASGVVAAGGTSVKLVDGQWQQRAWRGAGSGCSRYETQPVTQRNVAAITRVCARRATADVSALADPDTGAMLYLAGELDSSGHPEDGWYLGGGTSLATPLITAMYALAGNHTNPSGVYANVAAHPDTVTDVTSGQTLTCDSLTNLLCNAAPGWDGPTGLGTPSHLEALAAVPTGIAVDPATLDDDADGLTNGQEATLGTDPQDADTDDDALTDGQEVDVYRTDPLSVDTDSDGYGDGVEVSAGTDPTNASSHPAAISSGDTGSTGGGSAGGSGSSGGGSTGGSTGGDAGSGGATAPTRITVPAPAGSSRTGIVTSPAGKPVAWSVRPTAPGSYTYTARGLPLGLRLNADGTITGVPLRSGSGTVAVTVVGTPTGGSASSGSVTFGYTIQLNRFADTGRSRITGRSKITGRAVAGRKVTASLHPVTGVAGVRTTVTWYLNGRALKSHAATLRARKAWKGKRLSFSVTVSAPFYATVTYGSGNAVRVR